MRYACAVTASVLLGAPRVASAEEPATEKVAAADVIRRMNELERSLALPQLVARLTGARDPRRDAVIARAKDLMDRELLAMADDITRHPETGWKEERDRKSTRLNSSHGYISYAVFCLKKKKNSTAIATAPTESSTVQSA